MTITATFICFFFLNSASKCCEQGQYLVLGVIKVQYLEVGSALCDINGNT